MLVKGATESATFHFKHVIYHIIQLTRKPFKLPLTYFMDFVKDRYNFRIRERWKKGMCLFENKCGHSQLEVNILPESHQTNEQKCFNQSCKAMVFDNDFIIPK